MDSFPLEAFEMQGVVVLIPLERAGFLHFSRELIHLPRLHFCVETRGGEGIKESTLECFIIEGKCTNR
jgi:hypothetical protein